MPIAVRGVGVHQFAVLIHAIYRTRQLGVTLLGAGFAIHFIEGDIELLEDVAEGAWVTFSHSILVVCEEGTT